MRIWNLFRSKNGTIFAEFLIGVLVTVIGGIVNTAFIFPVIIALVCYLALSAKISIHLTSQEEFLNKFPILRSLSETKVDEEIISVINSQRKLSSDALKEVHSEMWDDYKDNIRRMSEEQKTGDLTYTLYLKLINDRVAKSSSGESICAISLMHEGEFIDSPLERIFYDEQIKASARGVEITRLFICSNEDMLKFQDTQYWQAHKLGQMDAYHITTEQFKRFDLDRKIFSGMICFNDQLFVDASLKSNWFGGHLSVKQEEIQRTQKDFKNHLKLAQSIPSDLVVNEQETTNIIESSKSTDGQDEDHN
jgi:hypothetical protein